MPPRFTDYAYDGLGNRLSKTIGATITEYLVDMQPSLAVILREKIGSQNTHYVHGLRGIQSQVASSVWHDAVSDGLGSVRGWLNSAQAFVSTANYDPYGVPNGTVDDFGFTGEMTDANGLVHLRARYYDPNEGVFASLDPFEGVNGRPMSMNGYSWVEGNPVMNTDPNGLCPRFDNRVQAIECERLRSDLRIWGFNVVYDIGHSVLEPSSLCIPQQCEEAVNQAQEIRQRFTLNEMSSIHNAVSILREAQQNIGFAPLNTTITIQKKREAGIVNLGQQTVLALTTGNTITLSAKWWGQGTRQSASGEYVEIVNGAEQEIEVKSIDSFAEDPQQYRSWLVLHEIGHVFANERSLNLQTLYQTLPQKFYQNYFPTRYAHNSDPREYMIEAITGVWWNNGYSIIEGYDSSAGGRTSPIDMVFEDRTIYITPSLTNPGNTFPLVVLNVGSDIWTDIGAPSTLQDWILSNILSE